MSDTPRTDAVYFRSGSTKYDVAGEMKELERENAKLRKALVDADELERYSGSDGCRQWGKCSSWLYPDDAVITISAKAFDELRKEAQL